MVDYDEPFLDVTALIERSQPQPRLRGGGFAYAAGVFLLVVLSSAYITSFYPDLASAVDVFSKLAMVGLMVGMALFTSHLVRRQRDEMKRVEGLEELVQLRRWPEAAGLAQELLSQPTRMPVARIQGLIFLSSILARYHRFEDAIKVHNYLLETVNFDEGTAGAIRVGRAMAMLREDHLVDADRAISELRRISNGRESAGRELVELYREVKTGHPNEAVERFNKSIQLFRQQLGHRTGDAFVLLARANDMLGRVDEAQAAYENATLLTAISELHRRYPEVAQLSSRYAPAVPPVETGVGVGVTA